MMHRLSRWLRRNLRREGQTSTDPPGGAVVHDVAQSHDEVEHYWTDERLRDAQPREIVREDPRTSTDPPDADRP